MRLSVECSCNTTFEFTKRAVGCGVVVLTLGACNQGTKLSNGFNGAALVRATFGPIQIFKSQAQSPNTLSEAVECQVGPLACIHLRRS